LAGQLTQPIHNDSANKSKLKQIHVHAGVM
jgi:hypothetical protein